MKRVLITRPRDQADEFAQELKAAGMEAVFFPVIEISPPATFTPLDGALKNLSSYDWIIFTSVNGVEAVWNRLEMLCIHDFPPGLRAAAVGPKTAASLEVRGIKVDFVPVSFTADSILPGLGELANIKVLIPQGDQARHSLAQAIRLKGGFADEVTAYQNTPAAIEPTGLQALRSGVDFVTFTSPSAARNFIDLVQSVGLNPFELPGSPKLICIGPITAEAAQTLGYRVEGVAEEYTISGLVQTLQKNEVI